MHKSLSAIAILALAAIVPTAQAQPRQLKSVGVTLGNMGNPFFVALARGAEAEAKKINPGVKFSALSADYDLAKQASQIDNFITSGVDLILVNAVDPKALESAINRAKKAGIVVVGVDAAAAGADAVVMTDNTQAGRIACDYIVEKLQGKGNVVIQNGPQVTAVVDRVNGCKAALAKSPDIKLLSSDQDAKGTREGGMNIMQGHLTRFPKIDAVFAINDPQAIGADLAARQLSRKGIVITAVDGAPDVEDALKGPTQIQASASQDPFAIAVKGVEVGAKLLNGEKPAQQTVLLPSRLVTRDNVKDYKGWQAVR
jgi:ribose transport system substrate-binding protein